MNTAQAFQDELIADAKTAGFIFDVERGNNDEVYPLKLTKIAQLQRNREREANQDEIQRLTEALKSCVKVDMKTARERYNAAMTGEEPDALERLCFFCSLAMNGQDWLDVEQFFDDVRKQINEPKPIIK